MATRLEGKLNEYDKASQSLQQAVKKSRPTGFVTPEALAQAREWQKEVVLAGLQFIRTIGDLAVTGIDEYAKVVAESKAIQDKLLVKDRRNQNIFLTLGLMFAAIAAIATAIQAAEVIHKW